MKWCNCPQRITGDGTQFTYSDRCPVHGVRLLARENAKRAIAEIKRADAAFDAATVLLIKARDVYQHLQEEVSVAGRAATAARESWRKRGVKC